MLFKTACDQQSTVQMMRCSRKQCAGLDLRKESAISTNETMPRFCSSPGVSCTQGRNGLSCLLWLYLQLPGVLFTASLHPFPAHLDCSPTAFSPSPAAIVPSYLSIPSVFSSCFLVLICEPPFLLILGPNTAMRKRSGCLSGKDVKNHET